MAQAHRKVSYFLFTPWSGCTYNSFSLCRMSSENLTRRSNLFQCLEDPYRYALAIERAPLPQLSCG
jgi:hypothetical protein